MVNATSVINIDAVCCCFLVHRYNISSADSVEFSQVWLVSMSEENN